MEEPHSPGRQLDSMDDIEDALEILKASGFQFVLMVGSHENGTSFYSDLTEDGGRMLESWIEDGRLNDYMRDHIQKYLD